MSVSYTYLALLETLNPRQESLDNWWHDLRAGYVSGNTAIATQALYALAETALTRVAKHKADQDRIAGNRGFNWWFGYLIGEMMQLHRNKNAGYSGHNDDSWHNFRVCNGFGVSTEHGIIARMCDKYARYINISSDPKLELVGESWYDTLQDLAAYALIFVIILREKETHNARVFEHGNPGT
jgi:hypothetical protein